MPRVPPTVRVERLLEGVEDIAGRKEGRVADRMDVDPEAFLVQGGDGLLQVRLVPDQLFLADPVGEDLHGIDLVGLALVRVAKRLQVADLLGPLVLVSPERQIVPHRQATGIVERLERLKQRLGRIVHGHEGGGDAVARGQLLPGEDGFLILFRREVRLRQGVDDEVLRRELPQDTVRLARLRVALDRAACRIGGARIDVGECERSGVDPEVVMAVVDDDDGNVRRRRVEQVLRGHARRRGVLLDIVPADTAQLPEVGIGRHAIPDRGLTCLDRRERVQAQPEQAFGHEVGVVVAVDEARQHHLAL